jgi:uncharacterized protein (DUF427 family)
LRSPDPVPGGRAPNGRGYESVWDYPRPPRIEPCDRTVRVEHGGEVIARSDRALRVLETAGAPTVYVPLSDVRSDLLRSASGTTLCECSGAATSSGGGPGHAPAQAAAWSYPDPTGPFERLTDHVAFYPGRVDACYLDDERVEPQPGGFYGGWVTAEIVGPIKGVPGSEGW